MTKLTEEEAYEEGRSCAKPVSQEPVAYEFQHEDTGRTIFVEPKQVEWGFEKNNPRLFKVGPVYRHPAQDRYALNTLDLIAANERAEAVEQQLLDAQARIAELESLHEKMVEFHGSSVRDAKRYRWLREHLNDTDSLTDLWPEGAEKTPTPDELDNAIDKALGE